jgi:hypothetical protein
MITYLISHGHGVHHILVPVLNHPMDAQRLQLEVVNHGGCGAWSDISKLQVPELSMREFQE